MIKIIISTDSGKPIYQQLFDQISAQIINGELACDQMLPSIRTVAKELRISVITVKKAWEQLERSGFIYSMVGKGCFISKLSKSQLAQKQKAMATHKIALDIKYYKQLGLSLSDIIDLVEEQY
jgi:GntR family transcriptional regulator